MKHISEHLTTQEHALVKLLNFLNCLPHVDLSIEHVALQYNEENTHTQLETTRTQLTCKLVSIFSWPLVNSEPMEGFSFRRTRSPDEDGCGWLQLALPRPNLLEVIGADANREEFNDCGDIGWSLTAGHVGLHKFLARNRVDYRTGLLDIEGFSRNFEDFDRGLIRHVTKNFIHYKLWINIFPLIIYAYLRCVPNLKINKKP